MIHNLIRYGTGRVSRPGAMTARRACSTRRRARPSWCCGRRAGRTASRGAPSPTAPPRRVWRRRRIADGSESSTRRRAPRTSSATRRRRRSTRVATEGTGPSRGHRTARGSPSERAAAGPCLFTRQHVFALNSRLSREGNTCCFSLVESGKNRRTEASIVVRIIDGPLGRRRGV